MRVSYLKVFVPALVAMSSPAFADGWSGKIGAGAIATGGNSSSSTMQLDFGLGFDQGIWHNKLNGSAIYASAETVDDATGDSKRETTSERYVLGFRSAMDFSDSDFVFLQLDAEKDLFGGIRERTIETLGYGRRVLKLAAHKLDLELGVGARQLKAQGSTERDSEMVWRTGFDYAWDISETSRFGQKLTVESGDANTYTESVTGLKLSVIGGVFANLGFTVKNNSDVPADTKKTDTIASVSLSWEF